MNLVLESHCPVLSAPKHGVIIGLSFVHDANVLFKCDNGFMLKDKSTAIRVCQKDNTWSGQQAECVGRSKSGTLN